MATETEKYSGLRLADRKIAAKRWDELMAGKKFTAFSLLTLRSTLFPFFCLVFFGWLPPY